MTTCGKYFLHSPASKLSREPKYETTGNDKTEKTLKKSKNSPNKTYLVSSLHYLYYLAVP